MIEHIKIKVSIAVEKEDKEYLCENCGREGDPPHTCPFELEVHANAELFCTCCEECTKKCLMET